MTCPLFTLVDRNGGWEKIGERERERDRKKERKKKRRKIFDFVTIQVENERFVAAYESSVFSLSLSLSLYLFTRLFVRFLLRVRNCARVCRVECDGVEKASRDYYRDYKRDLSLIVFFFFLFFFRLGFKFFSFWISSRRELSNYNTSCAKNCFSTNVDYGKNILSIFFFFVEFYSWNAMEYSD